MNYVGLSKYDTANGPGVRVSLFVSGCRLHCRGCFNEESWDFSAGKPFTDETLEEIRLIPNGLRAFRFSEAILLSLSTRRRS